MKRARRFQSGWENNPKQNPELADGLLRPRKVEALLDSGRRVDICHSAQMRLNKLKSLLSDKTDKSVRFVLPDDNEIPVHAAVTEVGYSLRKYVEPDGATGQSETAVVQVYTGGDPEHRVQIEDFIEMLELGGKVLPHDDLEVEVECDCCIVVQYPVAGVVSNDDRVDVILGHKQTRSDRLPVQHEKRMVSRSKIPCCC